MKIGAVIPTYNRRQLLLEAIDSLFKQTHPLDEIIVINNASTDDTREMLQTRYGAKITLVNLDSNTGSAGGFYYGIKKALKKSCDWVFIIDDDSELFPDSLEKLINNEKFNQTTSVLSPLKKDIDGTILINKHFGFFDFSIFGYDRNGLALDDLNKKFMEIDLTSFTGILINSLAIKQVGLPRQELFTQREDNDYCFRLRRYGKIYLLPDSIVLHKEKSHYIKVNRFGKVFQRSKLDVVWKEYYGFRNILFLFKQGHFPKWRYLNFFWYIIKTFLAIILLDKQPLIRWKFYLLGLYHGLVGKFGKIIDVEDFNVRYKNLLSA